MTYQVSVKDFRKAVANMKSNIATVVCSTEPVMSAYIHFLTRENGDPYYTCGFQVGDSKYDLNDNYPIEILVNDFNKKMIEFEENND